MQKQLHPGVKWSLRLAAYFPAAIFAIWAVVSISNLDGYLGGSFTYNLSYLLLLFIVIVVIVGEIYARLAYHFFRYEFTDDNLKMESGIIWKRYSNLPYERVQNVDIQRGIIARIFGFSSVNIQTAGYSMSMGRSGYGMNSEGHIPGVDMKEAEEIRDFVMKKISKKSKSGL